VRRGALALLAAATALAAPGCGTTILAATAAILASGGSHHSTSPAAPSPPAIALEAVAAPAAGDVALGFLLIDPASDPASIDVRVSLDGGATFLALPATPAQVPGNDGATGLATSPAGVHHVFVWHSFFDVGAANLDDVLFEVTPLDADETTRGAAARTPPFSLRNRYIMTVAGGQIAPDPGGATLPLGVAVEVDLAGNPLAVYFADVGLNQVFRLDAASGALEVVAGSGAQGFDGDNIPATSAALNAPHAVARDADGDLFIADTANHRIRRVSAATGFITTVAGNGVPTFAGDGGLATSASIRSPGGVALDPLGNLYISDSGNDRIRVVNRGSAAITLAASVTVGPDDIGTVASLAVALRLSRRPGQASPAAPFVGRGPAGLVTAGVPATGTAQPTLEIFFADPQSDGVWHITSAGAIVEQIGGVLTEAMLTPTSVALDGTGTVVVADAGRHRIAEKNGAAGALLDVAGTPDMRGFAGDGATATAALCNVPVGVGVAPGASGVVVLGDTFNRRIRAVNRGATSIAIAGHVLAPGAIDTIGRVGAAGGPPPVSPFGVAADAGGTFYYSDVAGGAVLRVDGFTGAETVVASGLAAPAGLALDAARHLLYVCESGGNRVRRLDLGTGVLDTLAGSGAATVTCADLGDGGTAIGATLRGPEGVAVAASGEVFIADTGNDRVRVVATDGSISTFVNASCDTESPPQPLGGYNGDGTAAGTLLEGPAGVLVDETAAVLLIADTGNGRVRSVPLAGGAVSTIVNANDTGGTSPTPITGYNGDGIAPAAALLDGPIGLAEVGGDLFIADAQNQRIRVVRGGLIFTAAGIGSAGFNGDAIPPENAAISTPLALAADDEHGLVLFADSGNLRVRRFAGQP
jgi:sugar lactone lactonase YvrE